jgi:hypothetical protein
MFSALKPLSALPSYSSVSLVRHCKLNIVLAIACVASVCVALTNKSRIAFRSVVRYSVHRVVNLNMTEAVQRCSARNGAQTGSIGQKPPLNQRRHRLS